MVVTVYSHNEQSDCSPDVVDIQDFINEHDLKLNVIVKYKRHAITFCVTLSGLSSVNFSELHAVGMGFTLDAALTALASNVCGNDWWAYNLTEGGKYLTGPYLMFPYRFMCELGYAVSSTPLDEVRDYTLSDTHTEEAGR